MIKIIAALAKNGVIGRGNDLPWYLPADLKWFKTHTKNRVVVMGSKTYHSILQRLGKPLPDRHNIVLTRRISDEHHFQEVEFFHHWENIVRRSETEDIIVIGGATLYELALPFAKQMYLTRVHTEPDGDTFFPEWNPSDWLLVSSESHDSDEKNEFPFTWEVWTRRQPVP